MKRIIQLIVISLAAVLLTSCPSGTKSRSESYLFVQKLGAGWNLGNTLDAYNDAKGKSNYGLGTETSWIKIETTQAMIHAVAQKGFKTIRIPVSWHNHITDENLTIDPAWLNRVKTIVDWALNENLYVIINIHHDNTTSEGLKNTYGFTLNTNATDRETSLTYITSIWKQVADFFFEYDEHLIFETLNEPRNRDSGNDGFSAPGNIRDLNRIINRYNQAALDAIRAAGGMNETRYVMVPTYAASPYDDAGWTEPTDSAESRVLVSVHAYTPYKFCMSSSNEKTFEISDEGNDINYLFEMLSDKWISRGYGVVIGETSASDKNNTSERLEWFDFFCKKAKNLGVSVILWDNNNISKASGGYGDIESGECHGYFNRRTLTWYWPSLVEAMIGE